jgi:CSLREA domain-containing protein
MLTRANRWLPLLCAAALLLSPLPRTERAYGAGTFTVNSTLDEPDAHPGDGLCAGPSGKCTLRAAVMEVQSTGPAGGVINLPSGTYRLTIPGEDDTGEKGDLDFGNMGVQITLEVTIVSAGAATTIIDGNGSVTHDRVIDIGSNAHVTISGVTIRGGRAGQGFFGHSHGGAIHNHGSLTLNDVAVANSTVPAAGWGGGGITTVGLATLTNVAITGNTAAENGGGIENKGTLTVVNTTISGNSAKAGGGVWNGDTGSTTLAHATIAGNSAPAGGGVFNQAGGFLQPKNSILANNRAANCAGPISLAPTNLDSGNSCGFNPGPGFGDLINTNPRLGPLRNNGGGTPTQALLTGSPAIDRGDAGECNATGGRDQRGADRPQDGNRDGTPSCDLGAYEVAPCPPPQVGIKAKLVKGARAVSFQGQAKVGKGCSLRAVRWDFGDGATSTAPSVVHTYAAAGRYLVTLTVTDNVGQSRTAARSVTVP